MDSDIPDEDDFWPSPRSELEKKVNSRKRSRSRDSLQGADAGSDEEGSVQTSDDEHPLKPSVDARWDRLKDFYSEEYMSLFHEYFADDSHGSNIFNTSQYGAVIWKPDEKAKFFQALGKSGKHEIERIADQIGTKSQAEVKAYISLLQKAELDRQLFEMQTKNISRAEMPAAVEVDVDYEQGLEKFADALAAYQDRYDQAVGQKQSQGNIPWLVTPDVAACLDKQADEAQNQSSDSDDQLAGNPEQPDVPHGLFKLSTFVELSDKIFMNGSRSQKYEHWRYSAEKGEQPCMTREVVEELHDIALNYLRRIMQTTIFLAQSRIRSTTNKHHIPTNEVKSEDVNAMRQVLNIKSDLWNYWTELPRRANFRVVHGDHRQAHGDKSSLTYDVVEAALSVKRHERRLRSLSVASTSSRSCLSGSEDSENSDIPSVRISRKSFAEYDEPPPLHISLQPALSQPMERGGRRKEPEFEIEIEDAGNSEDEDASGEHGEEESGDDHSLLGSTPAKKHSRAQILPRKRKRIEEEAVEIYLQDLDVYNRVQEEHRLTKLLGVGTPSGPIDNYADIGRRPKVRRKLADEGQIWGTPYRAAWEAYDLHGAAEAATKLEPRDILRESVEIPEEPQGRR